jgi:hypothetical protein
MVIYLHDMADALAGQDLRLIYDTRTLQHVHAVNTANVHSTVASLIEARMQVVVPDDPRRISNALHTVMRCLELLGMRTITVQQYLSQLSRPPAPATAPAHANAVGAGAG